MTRQSVDPTKVTAGCERGTTCAWWDARGYSGCGQHRQRHATASLVVNAPASNSVAVAELVIGLLINSALHSARTRIVGERLRVTQCVPWAGSSLTKTLGLPRLWPDRLEWLFFSAHGLQMRILTSISAERSNWAYNPSRWKHNAGIGRGVDPHTPLTDGTRATCY